MLVKISEIVIGPGRRGLDEAHIKELAKSMAEISLLSSITIDQGKNLIAGLHRLEAAKKLGWEYIECTVVDLSGLKAELAEIDENIVRCDLHYSDECRQLARRKEIYETLHPETKHGHRNGQTSKVATDATLETTRSFTADTSEKFGLAPRTIRAKVQVGKDLIPDVQQLAKKKNIRFRDAVKLSRLPPEQQEDAANQLISGEIREVEEYHTAQESNVDDQLSDSDVSNPPFKASGKQFKTIEESIADLKNPEKDCSCTTDGFLEEVTCFVQRFKKEIDWYAKPYYEVVYPMITASQLLYLRQQMDAICEKANTLYTSVERKSKNELPKKALSSKTGKAQE